MSRHELTFEKIREQEYLPILNDLINTMPCGVGIFVFSPKMECEFYSDGFAKMAGLSREAMDKKLDAGTVLSSLIAPMDYPWVMKRFAEKFAKGENLNLDYRYLYADGSVRWLHLTANKLREKNGYPVYYCVFTQPPEEATLYRSIVEDSSIGVLIAERKSRGLIYTNSVARTIYNLPEVMGDKIPLDKYMAQLGEQPLLSEADIATLEFDKFKLFHVKRKGSFYAASAKFISWNGVDAYVIYISDETKEMESKQNLEAFVNNVPGGLGIFDISEDVTKLVYLNDAFFTMLQIKPEDRDKYQSEDLHYDIHPEDRAAVDESRKRLLSGMQKDKVVYRIKNGLGNWLWVSLEAAVVARKADSLRAYVSFMDCDTLVKSQKLMEDARKKEDLLLSSIPGGVAIYHLKKDGRAVTEYVSEGLAKICGFDNKEECLAYLAKDGMVNVVPEDVPLILEAANKSLETHKPISVVYRIHVKNQEDILQRLDAALIEEGTAEDELGLWYAVHTKVSEDTLKVLAEQARYRIIMESLDLAFLEVEPGKSFYASSKYYDYMLSEESFDAVATNTANLATTHPDDLPLLQEFFTEVAKQKPKTRVVLRLKMKDGSYKWTEIVTFNYFDSQGQISRVVGILRDADKERVEQNEKLREALIAAQKANTAKTAFLSRMSHDMRTPLNGILGLTSFIKESTKEPKQLEDLNDLEVSGKYLLNLINDTLDVSRIESGRVDIRPVVCESRQLVSDLLKLANPGIQKGNITLISHVQAFGSEYVRVDKNRFEQAMMNILGNAIKFTPPGGTIKLEVVNIAKDEHSITDKIIIRDTGVGMSPEFLPHIFEAFAQEDNSLTSSKQGTGLGMAITKQLIELMGGTISVESQLGKGTTFTVIMKFMLASPQELAKETMRKPLQIEQCDFSGKCVLLCEDHPLNAKITSRLLKNRGIAVEIAGNGREGVELFAGSEPGHFHLILMDIRMPVMDGITAAKKIRSLEREDAKNIPIVAMTANAFEDDIEQTRAAGMNAHLSKPVDREQFYRVLAQEMKLV